MDMEAHTEPMLMRDILHDLFTSPPDNGMATIAQHIAENEELNKNFNITYNGEKQH